MTVRHILRPEAEFPYGVCYLAESERVVVLAVLHLARDPEVLRRRT